MYSCAAVSTLQIVAETDTVSLCSLVCVYAMSVCFRWNSLFICSFSSESRRRNLLGLFSRRFITYQLQIIQNEIYFSSGHQVFVLKWNKGNWFATNHQLDLPHNSGNSSTLWRRSQVLPSRRLISKEFIKYVLLPDWHERKRGELVMARTSSRQYYVSKYHVCKVWTWLTYSVHVGHIIHDTQSNAIFTRRC